MWMPHNSALNRQASLNNGFMATYILKLKWAWQASCLSHTLLILKIFTTFKDVQMILKQFFDISTGFRFSKMQ